MAGRHLFDLDDTLLYGTSAPVEFSRQLGLEPQTLALDQLCARFGVARAPCVAYRDSSSDKYLFGAVPVSVAVNGAVIRRASRPTPTRGWIYGKPTNWCAAEGN